MTFSDLEAAVAARHPLAADAPVLVRALWCDATGDWDGAHSLAQEVETPDGAWVHAYLHRREGDIDNAGYWYRRAGRPVERGDLQAEWGAIARALLASDERDASHEPAR
jgi:hypothetical protein